MYNNIKIIGFGDSITYGDQIPSINWCIKTEEILKKNNYNVEVINKGINGNTSSNGLDRFESDVLLDIPNILVIEFGINDANYRIWSKKSRVSVDEYEKNLREFVRICDKINVTVVFIVNHYILPKPNTKFAKLGNGKNFMENLIPYNNCIKKICLEHNIHFVDIPTLTIENGINPEEMLISDGLHLSEYGYDVYSHFVSHKLEEVIKNLDNATLQNE